MVTHSSTLARRIPWTEKPGMLQFMGLQRVEHDLATEQQQQKEIIPSHLSSHVSHVKTLLYRALPTRETLRI